MSRSVYRASSYMRSFRIFTSAMCCHHTAPSSRFCVQVHSGHTEWSLAADLSQRVGFASVVRVEGPASDAITEPETDNILPEARLSVGVTNLNVVEHPPKTTTLGSPENGSDRRNGKKSKKNVFNRSP
ncbi:hypothetical protein EVAR_65390_1 [Eumeta japonica]|uniref:Uncharacterized protein n=1 Tax=Eumeta variegata TaxID=151549 RepID=A0A4C1ZQ88_EUMVA|nr:hypothetical protein EVAR_65390_1 [Eumeta japonica]